MKIKLPRIDLNVIRDLAIEAVAQQVGQNRTSKAKKHRATKQVCRAIDALLVWPRTPFGLVAEALDGPAVRLIAAIVEEVYQAGRPRKRRK